jgi:CO/xanthine dehydrogenase FAD-binding subunit
MITFYASNQVLKDYFVASSVGEALGYLMAHHREAQIIAGGTYLMPQLQRGESRARRLVDVAQIGTLKRVTREDGRLIIGGAVTFAALLKKQAIELGCPLLQQAAQHMGTSKVRRLATLGGNLVSAQGNAAGSVALVAARAEVEVTNMTGSQWLPAESLFVRPGLSRVDSTTEIATAVRLRELRPGEGAALELLNDSLAKGRYPAVVACVIALQPGPERIGWASVAAGVAGQVPQRLKALEQLLVGASVDDPDLRQELAHQLVELLASVFPTAQDPGSRRLGALGRRLFDRALEMARASHPAP